MMLDYTKKNLIYTEYIFEKYDNQNRLISINHFNHYHYTYEYDGLNRRTRCDRYTNTYRLEYFNGRQWEPARYISFINV